MPETIKNVLKSAFKKTISSLKSAEPQIAIFFTPQRSQLHLSDSAHNSIGGTSSASTAVSSANFKEVVPVYSHGQNISGSIEITLPANWNSLEFDNISICIIGQVLCPKTNTETTFMFDNLCVAKGHPGILSGSTKFQFNFKKPNLKRDSYYGTLIACKFVFIFYAYNICTF